MTTADMHPSTWRVASGGVSGLEPGDVHVWRMMLAAPASSSSLEECRILLSRDECDRAARFRTEALRATFVLCHAALRRVLAMYCRVPPGALEFDHEHHGKPVLRQTASGLETPLHFNLSHSSELAVVGVSTQPVGVDVEQVRPMPDAERLASRFFSAAEFEALRLAPAGPTAAFFRCWTRKEAFVKAIGEGLSHPLAGFTVSLEAEVPALLHIAGSPGEAAEWSLPTFIPARGYIASIAIRRRRPNLLFFELPR